MQSKCNGRCSSVFRMPRQPCRGARPAQATRHRPHAVRLRQQLVPAGAAIPAPCSAKVHSYGFQGGRGRPTTCPPTSCDDRLSTPRPVLSLAQPRDQSIVANAMRAADVIAIIRGLRASPRWCSSPALHSRCGCRVLFRAGRSARLETASGGRGLHSGVGVRQLHCVREEPQAHAFYVGRR